jgi:hypothetical protein
MNTPRTRTTVLAAAALLSDAVGLRQSLYREIAAANAPGTQRVYGPVMGEGRLIQGRYRLEALVGRGVISVVWRAFDELLERDVALKEIVPGGALSADELADTYRRLFRGAKAAARVAHPGVVTVYDVIVEEDRPFVVMQFVNALSLKQVLAETGPLPVRRVALMAEQLLSALSAAHALGVLHRDVSPGNVLLGAGDRVMLSDFGIATFATSPSFTATGMVMGTPGFTAPERIRGADATSASDIWSLGATLFAAIEARGPYEGLGGAIETMSAMINQDPPRAAAAGEFANVIAALMRRTPEKRPDPATVTAMIAKIVHRLPDRLVRAQAGVGTPVGAASPAAEPARQGRRIFICYRHEDTAFLAGLLFDWLTSHFGADQVFKDVESIELGDNFVDVIINAVETCDVLIALIGDRWLTATDDEGRRRIDDHQDFVRIEIEAALARNIRVIPVLAAPARMPDADQLPPSLAGLAYRNPLELTWKRYRSDFSRLLPVLQGILD